jgi:hypothetical protein
MMKSTANYKNLKCRYQSYNKPCKLSKKRKVNTGKIQESSSEKTHKLKNDLKKLSSYRMWKGNNDARS